VLRVLRRISSVDPLVVVVVADHLFRIRTLTDFTYHQDGADKGAGGAE
jgi:hypothetical protein